MAAFVLGMIVPFSVIYANDLLDTKLHTRQDLERSVSAPVLGDIPASSDEEP